MSDLFTINVFTDIGLALKLGRAIPMGKLSYKNKLRIVVVRSHRHKSQSPTPGGGPDE